MERNAQPVTEAQLDCRIQVESWRTYSLYKSAQITSQGGSFQIDHGRTVVREQTLLSIVERRCLRTTSEYSVDMARTMSSSIHHDHVEYGLDKIASCGDSGNCHEGYDIRRHIELEGCLQGPRQCDSEWGAH